MRVAVDAGHGGGDPGAMYMDGVEKDIALMYAAYLHGILEARGHSPYLIRSDDTYIYPSHRAAMANQANSDVFVSLHCNSHAGQPETARGVEVLHFPSSVPGLFLAKTILSRWPKVLPNRGAKPRGDLAVLKFTRMPAVLVELAFINHSDDLALLKSDAYRTEACFVIADALEEYGGLI